MGAEPTDDLEHLHSEARRATAEAMLQIRKDAEEVQAKFWKAFSYGLAPAAFVIALVVGYLFNEKQNFAAFAASQKEQIARQTLEVEKEVAELRRKVEDIDRIRSEIVRMKETVEQAGQDAREIIRDTRRQSDEAQVRISRVGSDARHTIEDLRTDVEALLERAREESERAKLQVARARNSAYEVFIHFEGEDQRDCPGVTDVVTTVEAEGFILGSLAPGLSVDRQEIVYRRDEAHVVARDLAALLSGLAGPTGTKLVQSREADPRSFLIKLRCAAGTG